MMVMRLSMVLVLVLTSIALAAPTNTRVVVRDVDVAAGRVRGSNARNGRAVTVIIPADATISRLGPPRRTITISELKPGDEMIVRGEASGSRVTAMSIRVTTPDPAASTPTPADGQKRGATLEARFVPLPFQSAALNPDTIPWTRDRAHRVIVEVPPTDLAGRTTDDAPAALPFDAIEQLGTRIDVRTIHVVRIDPATGEPMPGDGWAHAPHPEDRTFRWLDDAIPAMFPEAPGPLSRANKPRVVPAPNVGHHYAATGDWRSGRLTFMHTQDGDAPSYYTIYFDALPDDDTPQVAPRGWLGDGLTRNDIKSRTTFQTAHVRIDLDDVDGDGDIDLIAGEQYGQLMWLPNIGTAQNPQFNHLRLLYDANGQPIDVGVHAAPKVVDFDGDGVRDLLVGTYSNRIAYYRNVGTNEDRRYTFHDVVRIDGEPLELPHRPIIGRSEDVFTHDYYPVLDWIDFDGDGREDLIAGGYVTGRIFLYRNTGRGDDGLPVLQFVGPIEADGKPINVGDWCAAPALADLDGDGLPDLLTGSLGMTPESSANQKVLLYYRNVGSPGNWRFTETPLPVEGQLPAVAMVTPRVADLNGDGLLDIAFSSSRSIYLMFNVGTPTQPRFRAPDMPVVLPWGPISLPGQYFLDYDRDGKADMVNGYSVHLASNRGNPFAFPQVVDAMRGQPPIRHDSGIGDDWFWPRLVDLDQDGDWDILFGDWGGYIWLHAFDGERFDETGVKLTFADGTPIRVGPALREDATKFDQLQGARTVFAAADFDGDGDIDLVISDTFGDVHYAENIGDTKRPVFAPFVTLGSLGIRIMLDAADFDGDGTPDIIAGGANGQVRIWLNTGNDEGPRFRDAIDPGLPPIKQPRLLAVDLNGDGDIDLFSPSTMGSVWVERSFLERGYAPAKAMHIAARPGRAPATR